MNNRNKSILLGLIAGAVIGAAFAWVVSDGDESEESRVAQLKPTDYFSLGMSLLTLARQFSDMLR